jgi:hypothetical protein
MPRQPQTIAERATAAQRESRTLDFKERFDPGELCEWLELIKDFVAMANSGGGLVLIGVCNNGTPSGADVQPVLDLDPAKIADKIESYTHVHFADFQISEVQRAGSPVAVIAIGPSSEAPIVFTRAGTYTEPGKKYPKTAFAMGTVYFRHGAKSEPGTTADLRAALDRRVDSLREQWKEGMRQVVEAPEGAMFAVVEAVAADPTGPPVRIRLTNDPDAPAYGLLRPDQTHPHRQTELLKELNKRLPTGVRVTTHDFLSARRAHGISAASHPEFAHQPRYGSQQYSDQFVDWLYDQWKADHAFFEKAKAKARQRGAQTSARST